MHHCSKDAFVMVANCPKEQKIFGITVDRLSQGRYSLIWSFKLNPQQANREGFGDKKVNGSLGRDPGYPGCPYCGCQDLVFCECGAVMCWRGEKIITCPKCGNRNQVTMVESVDMHGGGM